MSVKHTAGPWEIAHMDDDDGGLVMIQRPEPNHVAYGVAYVYGHGGDLVTDGERWANARLLASAPRLLAALEAAAASLAEVYRSDMEESGEFDMLPPPALEGALDAIAEAKGAERD